MVKLDSFVLQITAQKLTQGFDGMPHRMVFPSNHGNHIRKKFLFKRNRFCSLKLEGKCSCEIPVDGDTQIFFCATGFIHIEGVANLNNFSGMTVIILTEFQEMLIEHRIRADDHMLPLKVSGINILLAIQRMPCGNEHISFPGF